MPKKKKEETEAVLEEKPENEKLAKLKEKLKEKAEKLAEKISSKEISLKKETEKEEKYETAPIEDFLKSSIHLGTRAITPDMRQFVYKRRADSLAVFDTTRLDKKLIEAGKYLSKFAPNEVILVCKREAGVRAVQMFSKSTGIKEFTKYPVGILTNPQLDTFLETELVLICDPWLDKNALDDAKKIRIPVMAVCDTNNYTMKVDFVVPGNNKSAKSLGFIFYHLARLYIEHRKLDSKLPPISKWIDNWDNLVPPK